MKVFLSWSGSSSFKVANSLRNWLPTVLQAIKPWLSEEDINKGSRWSFELSEELESTQACIVCLTPDSLTSEWIHFEAGAASKVIDKSLICPYLVGMKKSDLSGPLAQFQAADNTRNDTLKLLKALNEQLGSNALDIDILTKTFDRFWSELDAELKAIDLKNNDTPVIRTQNEVIEEILERVRRIEGRSFSNHLDIQQLGTKVLSSREVQVFKLLVGGQSIEEIGKALDLSLKTVNTYKYRLFDKLGVKNEHQLLKYFKDTITVV